MTTTTPAPLRPRRVGSLAPCPFAAFEPLLPTDWLEGWLADHAWTGRRRDYDPAATLWRLVEAALAGGASQRLTVLGAGFDGRVALAPGSGALSKARDRLPAGLLETAGGHVAAQAVALAPPLGRLDARPVYLLDGVCLRLLDTAANQAAYPQPSTQRPGAGWPVLHQVVLVDLRTGCLVASVAGSLHDHDGRLGQGLWDRIPRGSVVIADCAFASWAFLAYQAQRGVAVVVRQHQRRVNEAPLPADRDGDDRWETWPRPAAKDLPAGLAGPWPAQLRVRVVRERVGGEVRCTNTTLPAGEASGAEVLALYGQRWPVELRLRELKQDLGGALLAVTSPPRAQVAWAALGLTHNLLCAVTCAAAQAAGLPRARISYTAAQTLVRASRRGEVPVEGLGKRVLERLGAFPLPERDPGRWEPRAAKERPRKYDRLTQPRAKLKAAHPGREPARGTPPERTAA